MNNGEMRGRMPRLNKKIKINKKVLACLSLVILFLCLLPLITMAFYRHPQADDYIFALPNYNWRKRGGFSHLFFSALWVAKETYFRWQGTYTRVFLFSFVPALLGQKYYFIGALVLIFSFVASTFFLLYVILVKKMKIDVPSFAITASAFTILCLEAMPSTGQGFYWWNGASYYVLFYSLELVTFGLILLYLEKKNAIKLIGITILVFLVAGGNFVTALNLAIILSFVALLEYLRKKEKSLFIFRGRAIWGLAISVLAPGNAVRAQIFIDLNSHLSPFKAIVSSFPRGLEEIIKQTSLFPIIMIGIMLFALYPTYKNSELSFKHPLLIVAVNFCIFCALFTPSLYGIGSPYGDTRTHNIIWFAYVWMAFADMYYLVGWAGKKLSSYGILGESSFSNFEKMCRECSLTIILFFCIVTSLIFIGQKENMWSYLALRDQVNGVCQKYEEEFQYRLSLLENDSIKEVQLPAFTQVPDCLYVQEYESFHPYIAQIYNKISVSVVE